MDTTLLSLRDAQSLVQDALAASGANLHAASATASALVAAEADGQKGHGLARVPSYAGQVKSGKVNGGADPRVISEAPSGVVIDADFGFAYPAINLAIEELPARTRNTGIAAAAIQRSHHFGQAGAHAERLAEKGFIALVFGNSPKGIAFWGAAEPSMGTNPIAFSAPLPEGPPMVIDLAMSVAARGKIIAAQKNGETIPEGWAFDQTGEPTTDPDAALAGSMAPMGGAKGAALALMIEVLAAALTGSQFGFEASSLFSSEGEPPHLGQMILAIDPTFFSGGAYLGRMGILLAAIEDAEGARLPGSGRLGKRAQARETGLPIPASLYDEICTIAGRTG